MNKHIGKLISSNSHLIELSKFNNIDQDKISNYITENYPMSLNEMARINVDEFYGYFPTNKFDIKIWSNDHNPPHFHVITDDGWDIIIDIKTGSIIKTKHTGTDSKLYKYIQKYINIWLDEKSILYNNITNRENAINIWKSLHC